ncbi:MAG: NAD(P)/FAD-dependent oxidoreductase [Planctomycetota bacterium]
MLGGGFGGLDAARGLAHAPVRVSVVDARNHHLFQPLLYQVATAGLSPGDIAEPIRHVLRHQHNAETVLARAAAVDRAGRRVLLEGGRELRYDYLVVATGVTHSYFGHDEWQEHAPGLKSVEEALDIRRRVLEAYERAEQEPDPAVQAAWLTFVVVGGGPTGAELAGALAELSRHTLTGNFRRIDPRAARVLLCEGSQRVLGTFAPELSAAAQRALERLGVEVRLGRYVQTIDGEGVVIGGERIPARTVLWAAGVQGTPLLRTLGAPLDRAGRVLVEADLSVPGDPRVFVIGDAAAARLGEGWVPGVAPAAMQGGSHAARQIRRQLAGEPPEPFRYVDKGSMATIGRSFAIAELLGLKLRGFVAWLAWLFVHILFLIGFRNRVLVLFQWCWAYLTFQRGARLITRGVGEAPEGAPGSRP